MERIAAIREECDGVASEAIKMQTKSGGEFTIQGHTIAGVLANVRPLLNKHGVLVTPDLLERTYSGNRCDVLVKFRWECVDNPADYREITWAGADTDNGGKGFAKAGTNALKEHLKKFLLITDREDRKEETEAVEHQTDEQVSRARVEAAQEQARRALESWAKGYLTSIRSAKNVKALKALKADNAEPLADKALPGVTKTYLEDAYKERMAVLEDFEKDQTDENEETLR